MGSGGTTPLFTSALNGRGQIHALTDLSPEENGVNYIYMRLGGSQSVLAAKTKQKTP
jgi:hypothetical protein